MTNDIKMFKDKYLPLSNLHSAVRESITLGDKDKAKKIIIDAFFQELRSPYLFSDAKYNLETRFKAIGEELPDNIKNLTADDFVNFFNP
jgi:hypothetical protein